MKVLHFYKTYLPETIGGIEAVINQIVVGVEKFGISSEILTLTPKKTKRTIKVNGFSVHRCKSNFEIASTPFSISVILRFKELVKDADIIHYHYPYPYADLLHFLTQVKKPTIISYHSDIVRQKNLHKLYKPLKKYFFKRVNCIVAGSPTYLSTSRTLADYKHKTIVIPYGLDKKNYPVPSAEKLNYWRLRFGESFFLFIGVLRYYKGINILIEAARDTNYPIVIVGSGPMEKELQEHVKNLGIKNIFFIGRQSHEDKAALLKLCYAIVFPSHMRSEAFGMSLLEGAMYGKPLISCEIGTGTSFVNIDGKTGRVVTPNDYIALREAMDYLWNNKDTAREMGRRAEKRYWDIFTADKMAKSYADLYQSILD